MPHPPPGVGFGYRIFQNDNLDMRTQASVAVVIQAKVTVLYDDGSMALFDLSVTSNADRTTIVDFATVSKAVKNGWVVGVAIDTPGTIVKRGTLWVDIGINTPNITRTLIARGYHHSENFLALGKFDNNGPPEQGFVNYRKVADNVAPADIQHTLALPNTLVRVDGFIWYYHASGDVANRTLRASLRDVGDGLPTGMTSGGNTLLGIWPSAAVITLTQDQEGTMFVKDQYQISLDNGTPTFEDPSARPTPFPLWIQEDDVGEFFFDVTDEEAADRHTIYLITEEWLQF